MTPAWVDLGCWCSRCAAARSSRRWNQIAVGAPIGEALDESRAAAERRAAELHRAPACWSPTTARSTARWRKEALSHGSAATVTLVK